MSDARPSEAGAGPAGATDAGATDAGTAGAGAPEPRVTEGAVPDPATVSTPAIESVRALGLPHTVVTNPRPHTAEESAALQGVPLEALFRTIVVRRGDDDYLFVLVPGGRRFDWPKLRAHLGVSRMSLPDKDEARAVTGYERGTITPFGASRAWPVIVDASALGLDRMSIGGGAFGVNLHLAPDDLVRALGATVVDVTVPEDVASD